MTEKVRLTEQMLDALSAARETIKAWHNMSGKLPAHVWEIYDRCSPEMKKINAAIEAGRAALKQEHRGNG